MKTATARPFRVREVTLDGLIDALLIEWHQYRAGYQLSVGHRSASVTTQDYQTPGHHDWKNGAADERAEKYRSRSLCEAVDAVPNEPQPWHTTLVLEAHNLAAGVRVWSSSRLPQDPEELDVLRLEARTRFAVEAKRRSLIA